jgi:hypothetical protein
MYFTDLHIYAQFILVLLGLLVVFPWVAIPAIAIYKFFQVSRFPKASVADEKISFDANLGLTMADGGEYVKDKKN